MARMTVSEGQNIQVHSGHEPMQAMCFRNTVSVSNALSPHGEKFRFTTTTYSGTIGAVLAGDSPVSYRTVPVPSPGHGQVLFRVQPSAPDICGSAYRRRTASISLPENLRSSTPRARRLTDAEELKPAPIGESAASARSAREARRGPSAIDEHARDMVAAGDPRSALRRRQPHDKAPPESSAARRAGYRRVKVSYPVA